MTAAPLQAGKNDSNENQVLTLHKKKKPQKNLQPDVNQLYF